MVIVGKNINNSYRIIAKIGEGRMSSVWLAERLHTRERVAIKFLKQDGTSHRVEDVIRFRNEADAIAKITQPSVVKILEIGEFEQNNYLVMEYLEGKSLAQLLEEGETFNTAETVEIIYLICEGLKQVHNANIIHRDLKPGNVIVKITGPRERRCFEVKLIDFGLSRVRELDLKQSRQMIGTLHYMAPEQTGAVKCNVDERSDLYSLGVIFYQLLTNKLPFDGDNINTLIHQHIAKIPQSVSTIKPELPVILDQMVGKLLEKEVEQRYQSAGGLLYDLKRYQNGEIDFKLGLRDHLTKLNYRVKLVGREEELNLLKTRYERAVQGNGSICLISGAAGKGKTRLAEELRKCQDGIFIHGKCFSGENKVPYGPVKEALNTYLNHFMHYTEADQAAIRHKLREAVGNLGRVMLNLNPLLETLLGECPPLVKLEPERELNRFKMVVSAFLVALGEYHQVVVLMLDDLQWVDEGTIDLLTGISGEIARQHLLVIGTFRNDEVKEEHILRKFIANAISAKCQLVELPLQPFDAERMDLFISRLLYEDNDHIKDVAAFILQKSKGNPFFAIQILKQLVQEKVIVRQEQGWKVNRRRLSKVEVPASLIDIILKRVSELSEKEQEVLGTAALIGKQFNIVLLFEITALGRNEILAIVDKAIEMQFLERNLSEPGSLVFVHDRIKEAIYKGFTEEKQRALHLEIARFLEANNSDPDKVVFDLARHYVAASDISKAVEYVCLAGKKAQESFANETALDYFRQGERLLESQQAIGSAEWQDCIENIIKLYILLGKGAKALELLYKLLFYKKSDLDKSYVYMLISRVYFTHGDYPNFGQYARLGLELLGCRLPEGNKVFWELAKEILIHLGHCCLPDDYFLNKKAGDSAKYKLVTDYLVLLNWCYGYTDTSRMIWPAFKALNLAESKLGRSWELVMSKTSFACLYMGIPWFKTALKYFLDALRLMSETDGPWYFANCSVFLSNYYTWSGNCEQGVSVGLKCAESLRNIGDIQKENLALNALVQGYYYQSDYVNMRSVNDQLHHKAVKIKDFYSECAADIYYIQYYRELGDFETAESYGLAGLRLASERCDWFNYCSCHIELGILYLEQNDFNKAMQYLEKARAMDEQKHFLKQYTVLLYSNLAEAYIQRYYANRTLMTGREKKRHLRAIKAMCQAARLETRKWPLHYGSALRVTARYYELLERLRAARKMYLLAINHCKKYHRRYETAKALYDYGLFLRWQGQASEAKGICEEAYYTFCELGSGAYREKLERLLGIDPDVVNCDARLSNEIRYSQRISSLISIGRVLSSILDLDTLLDKVMDIALEVSGAQNGYFLIRNERNGQMDTIVKKITNKEMEGFSGNIARDVFQNGEAVLSTNAAKDHRFSGYQSVLLNEVKSVLCIPVKYNNEIKGVCYLDNQLSSGVFTKEDIDILDSILIQAAISIENAKLYKMAITDGLTGLLTHRHFQYMLDRELERAERYQKEFSVIIFDVDFFKNFNDQYGHQMGDQVLTTVAQLTKECLRNTDIIARYGGEEFVVIMPETGCAEAAISAERLRNKVRNWEMAAGDDIKITISLGVASFPLHARDGTTLVRNADAAMYHSKAKGRDRVTVFTDEILGKKAN